MPVMRSIICFLVLLFGTGYLVAKPAMSSPLAAYSAEWNDAKYEVCNTAAHTRYLNEDEKRIIYILNLARMNPRLFCKTVLPHAHEISHFADLNSSYYQSLVREMETMQPMGLLVPDSLCFVSADCHAVTAGRTGYVGHERQSAECKRKEHFYGECCQFGVGDPLGIIINLLIDQDTPSLGHRRNCLNKEYKQMSAAIAPHKEYKVMTVMDFY